VDEIKGKSIAVDLDETLCTAPEGIIEWMDFHLYYPKMIPIKENIDKVNNLAKYNNVVIYTARPWEGYKSTLEWLMEHEVMFHYLIMGKFRADLYIDNDSCRMEEV